MDTRSLAAYSVLALAAALLVLILFHLAAVNGWDTRFYETRFPYLALPILAGLAGFAAYPLGRRAAWVAALGVPAGALLMARLGYPGASLAVAASVIAVLGIWRIRGILAGGRSGLAAWLVVLASAVDVVMWIHPPNAVAGFQIPQPPASFLLAAASLLTLVAAVRLACGAVPPRTGHLFLAAGLLGGYGIGTLLAAVGWLLWRAAARPAPSWNPQRARSVAIQGIHIALALSLVGYATSTYAKTTTEVEIARGGSATVAGWRLTYLGSGLDASDSDSAGIAPDGAPADTVRPIIDVERGQAAGTLQGRLEWYSGTGTYLAAPDQFESWDADVYIDTLRVHVAPGGACANDAEGRWVDAFQVEEHPRICVGDAVDAVQLTVVVLPGLAILWGAWALGIAAVVALAMIPRKPMFQVQEGVSTDVGDASRGSDAPEVP